MRTSLYIRAGLLALFLVTAFVIGWEAYWRLQGFELSYNDDEPLWAFHRQRIYESSPAAPVMIGSSRIKFGLDLTRWEEATGADPIQLALVGTSPRPVLANLAQDENFKGTVLVGVTEFLFFSPPGGPFEIKAHNSLKFYPDWSMAQQASFRVNQALESQLMFLDEERFALRFLLDRLYIPNRPGVFAIPPFPLPFTVNYFNRQTSITEEFMADTALQNQQKQIWVGLFTNAPKVPMADSTLNAIFDDVKASVAKIQARGGKVLFVRMPSTGPIREFEKQAFPREKFWDRLLHETGAPGIHFEDYPQLASYPCVEWSHLGPEEAKAFTRDFIQIMQQETGWSVQKAQTAQADTAIAVSTSTLTSR